MSRDSRLNWIAGAFALLLVVVQFAVALHLCDPAVRMAVSGSESGMGDCMKHMPSVALSLCMLHCDRDAQSDQTAFPKLLLPVVAVMLLAFSLLFFPSDLIGGQAFPLGALISSSPPLRFQYQTFRN